MGGLVPHSSGQTIQSRPQQSHCSTLRKTASAHGLRRSPSEGLCARRPHPTGHATRAVFFPPQVFVEDDGHPEDEVPRTEMRTQPRERGESPQQEKYDGHEHQCGADDEQRPFPPQPVAFTPADPPKPPGSTPAARPTIPPDRAALHGRVTVGGRTDRLGPAPGGRTRPAVLANRPGLGSGTSRSTRSSTIAATAGRCMTRRGDPARCGPERGIVSPR